MYSVRLLTEDDYGTLCGWWTWHRFPIPPREFLPNNGTCGVMVSLDGVDACAGFLYFTNSKLCWAEYIVSSPNVRKDRDVAIQGVITELAELAKAKGAEAIFTSLKNERLIRHYEACGYTKGSNNTCEMILKL